MKKLIKSFQHFLVVNPEIRIQKSEVSYGKWYKLSASTIIQYSKRT